ncbi:MAG: GNAT family N-acetyltransferase [Lachnospiraceae bacterium]|nr:GNAT family N-acetyltransferase [Lachnospiraceae bacterium]
MKIELKKWTEENKNDLIRICNSVDRKYLTGRLPYPYTEESANWWYENVVSGDGKNGIFRSVAVDSIIVGSISVEQKSDIYIKDTEIGYMLLSEYHGKGIMTEATRQICKLAFVELDIERITGNVFSPNIASQKVLLKNNFELEGIMKKAIYKNGNIADLHIYGKCKA